MNIEINNNIIIIEKHIYEYGSCGHCNLYRELESNNGILSIVITNLPLHISRYFTKIRLNYNPINKKIHMRCNSADQDIAYRFGIVDNNKEFDNANDVIAYIRLICNPCLHNQGYKQKYYKYKQKYLQLSRQLELNPKQKL